MIVTRKTAFFKVDFHPFLFSLRWYIDDISIQKKLNVKRIVQKSKKNAWKQNQGMAIFHIIPVYVNQ